MNRKNFRSTCEALGMNEVGVYYFGIVEGWPARAMLNNGFLQLLLNVAAERDKEKKSALKASLGKKCDVSDGGRGVLTLTLNLRRYDTGAADAVRETLSAVGGAGYAPLDVCPLCGASSCDTAAIFGNTYRLTHRACLQKRAYEANESVKKNKRRGSYLLGTLGAMLGMLLGTVPTVLTVLFTETEYALLLALVPLGAYFGYKLFFGKMNRYALVITIIMSVLSVYAMAFICAVFWEMQGSGYPLYASVIIFAEYASVFENWLVITRSSAQEFLFAGLGVWISWRIISDTAAKRAELAEETVALSEPYSRTE